MPDGLLATTPACFNCRIIFRDQTTDLGFETGVDKEDSQDVDKGVQDHSAHDCGGVPGIQPTHIDTFTFLEILECSILKL